MLHGHPIWVIVYSVCMLFARSETWNLTHCKINPKLSFGMTEDTAGQADPGGRVPNYSSIDLVPDLCIGDRGFEPIPNMSLLPLHWGPGLDFY